MVTRQNTSESTQQEQSNVQKREKQGKKKNDFNVGFARSGTQKRNTKKEQLKKTKKRHQLKSAP